MENRPQIGHFRQHIKVTNREQTTHTRIDNTHQNRQHTLEKTTHPRIDNTHQNRQHTLEQTTHTRIDNTHQNRQHTLEQTTHTRIDNTHLNRQHTLEKTTHTRIDNTHQNRQHTLEQALQKTEGIYQTINKWQLLFALDNKIRQPTITFQKLVRESNNKRHQSFNCLEFYADSAGFGSLYGAGLKLQLYNFR